MCGKREVVNLLYLDVSKLHSYTWISLLFECGCNTNWRNFNGFNNFFEETFLINWLKKIMSTLDLITSFIIKIMWKSVCFVLDLNLHLNSVIFHSNHSHVCICTHVSMCLSVKHVMTCNFFCTHCGMNKDCFHLWKIC